MFKTRVKKRMFSDAHALFRPPASVILSALRSNTDSVPHTWHLYVIVAAG